MVQPCQQGLGTLQNRADEKVPFHEIQGAAKTFATGEQRELTPGRLPQHRDTPRVRMVQFWEGAQKE